MRFVARFSGDHDDLHHDEHLNQFEPGKRGKSPTRLIADAKEFERFAREAAGKDVTDMEHGETDAQDRTDERAEASEQLFQQ